MPKFNRDRKRTTRVDFIFKDEAEAYVFKMQEKKVQVKFENDYGFFRITHPELEQVNE